VSELKIDRECWRRRRITSGVTSSPWFGEFVSFTADKTTTLTTFQRAIQLTLSRLSFSSSSAGGDWVSMQDHCRWKFHGFPEGNTYSGRLRYIQNCRSVIVTHEPRWLQHWTHLYNADWNSPDQNIVFVPPAIGSGTGDRTWERLPETMDRLLRDDKLARKIADNQWNFFRER